MIAGASVDCCVLLSVWTAPFALAAIDTTIATNATAKMARPMSKFFLLVFTIFSPQRQLYSEAPAQAKIVSFEFAGSRLSI